MRRAIGKRRPEPAARGWWQGAVFYRVHVRSFADSDGDGVGDLEGIRGRLGYLELLGVDALSLTPFYLSPAVADGYDVAGPRAVDPVLGNLERFDELVADVHASGIRLLLDLVPNHTSDRHTWFTAALAAPPGSSERERYHFHDGTGPGGELPPNNWIGTDGAPAWTRLPDGQWYLHLFGPGQPDLNWTNAEVHADLERTLRFWLDRGVDGFRICAAQGMAKPAGLPDMAARAAGTPLAGPDDPRFDNDGVHEIHQMIRKVLAEYPDTVAVGEIRARDEQRFARYLRRDELHLGLDLRLGQTRFDADALQAAIERSLALASSAGAPATWAPAGHAGVRQVTRFGGGADGRDRARAMALVELALPGAIWLQNGEELGLDDAGLGEGTRAPIPWEGPEPPFGFSGATAGVTVPREWAALTVEAQLEDSSSTLSLYRRALDLRRERTAFDGDEIEWYGAPPGCFAFRRHPGGLVCALNTSAAPVPLPPGEVLLSSAPLVDGKLAAGAAAWLVSGRSAAASGR
ncbi:alpha-amylase family glycosyl hydrolase [Qaidamihabitans albus]|uniref:alpha-amylase family glycosyl hydrolase n=1 Tax=Qaidamihabitans albus TaxID=2795733 RepID=UPI0018F243AB|nr:alpha-amylase family glycosyl hydrolase [Qaidamihabitans albus]